MSLSQQILARKGRIASPAAALLLTWCIAARAAPSTPSATDACLDAYGRAQDAKAANRLSEARELFLACARARCPPVVQAECANQVEATARAEPTVIFVARDSSGADVADTAIDVDGKRLLDRSDGKAYPLDPGRHAVRFLHAGREVSVDVVLSEGQKGREVVATFAAPHEQPAVAPLTYRRPTGPLWLAAAGGAVFVTGVVLTVVGVASVPGSCHFWDSRACAVPPGDGALGTAHDAVTLANAGLVTIAAGAAAATAGVIWYFLSPKRAFPSAGANGVVAPWLTPSGGGVAWQATL